MTSSEYEMMMVNRAGGCPSAKPVVQIDPEKEGSDATAVFVVQNDVSFRESFAELMFRRGAAMRIVG